MRAICADGTTFDCATIKAVRGGVLLFDDEEREQVSGFVPSQQLRYVIPDRVAKRWDQERERQQTGGPRVEAEPTPGQGSAQMGSTLPPTPTQQSAQVPPPQSQQSVDQASQGQSPMVSQDQQPQQSTYGQQFETGYGSQPTQGQPSTR